MERVRDDAGAKGRVPIASAGARTTLVVGSVAFDSITTPTESCERTLGGAASYASIAASYFSPVRLVAIVGHDFGRVHIDRFKRREIDLEGLEVDTSGSTFFWAGKYHEHFNSRDTIETHLNVFDRFRPDLPERYRSSPYVLLANIGPDLQRHVLRQIAGEAFVLADSMDLWINTMRDELLALIQQIDCLAINESEAALLTGHNNLFIAGEKLMSLGPKMAIIKKGEHGALLFHSEGLFSIPAYPVRLIRDPTGAGDAFAGALVGYLAAVGSTSFDALKHAMLYATVTASLTIEAFSCDRLGSAGVPMIVERYEELREIIAL